MNSIESSSYRLKLLIDTFLRPGFITGGLEVKGINSSLPAVEVMVTNDPGQVFLGVADNYVIAEKQESLPPESARWTEISVLARSQRLTNRFFMNR